MGTRSPRYARVTARWTGAQGNRDHGEVASFRVRRKYRGGKGTRRRLEASARMDAGILGKGSDGGDAIARTSTCVLNLHSTRELHISKMSQDIGTDSKTPAGYLLFKKLPTGDSSLTNCTLQNLQSTRTREEACVNSQGIPAKF